MFYLDKNPTGAFQEKEYRQWFTYRPTLNNWGTDNGLMYEIDVLNGIRFAKILKTIAYVAIDEDENGLPILERWEFVRHEKYRFGNRVSEKEIKKVEGELNLLGIKSKIEDLTQKIKLEKDKQKVKDMFGNRQNFELAVSLVLKNYAQSSGINGKTPFGGISRSWEVLLPMCDGNEQVAKERADIVNRAIGFPGNQYNEMVALGVEKQNAGKKFSASKEARLAELKAKFKNANVSDEQAALAILGSLDQNELGAKPMSSTNFPFMKIRVDRINSMSTYYDKFGNGNFPITSFAYGLGNIAWSRGNGWNQIQPETVSKLTQNYNLGSGSIVNGVVHPSGYSAFQLSFPMQRNAKGAFIGKPKDKFVLFDPERKEIDFKIGGYSFSDCEFS